MFQNRNGTKSRKYCPYCGDRLRYLQLISE